MDTAVWVLGLVILGVGAGIAWAFFYASIGRRGDALRKDDPNAAAVHDAAFMQTANPAVLPMRDRAFDKPQD